MLSLESGRIEHLAVPVHALLVLNRVGCSSVVHSIAFAHRVAIEIWTRPLGNASSVGRIHRCCSRVESHVDRSQCPFVLASAQSPNSVAAAATVQ